MQARPLDDYLRCCKFVRLRNEADRVFVVEHVLSLSLENILEVVIDLCLLIALAFTLFFNDFSSQCFLLLRFILNNDTLNSFRDLLPFSHSLTYIVYDKRKI
jgi:hypothetical protein